MKLSGNLNLLVGAVALLGCGQHFLIEKVVHFKDTNMVRLTLSSIDDRGHDTTMGLFYDINTGESQPTSKGSLFNIVALYTSDEYAKKLEAKTAVEKLDRELRNQLEVENYAVIGMMLAGGSYIGHTVSGGIGLIFPTKPEPKPVPKQFTTAENPKVEFDFKIRYLCSPNAQKETIKNYTSLMRNIFKIDADKFQFRKRYDFDNAAAVKIRCSYEQFSEFLIARKNLGLQNLFAELNAKII